MVFLLFSDLKVRFRRSPNDYNLVSFNSETREYLTL